TPIPPMRADWTASGACTNGSTAPPKGATRRAPGGSATTSTTWVVRRHGRANPHAANQAHRGDPGVAQRRRWTAEARKHPRRIDVMASAALEQRHEPQIHVRLHVAVEKAAARLIGSEVDRHLLEAAEHRHILDHPRRPGAGDAGDLEA